jgi:hypothetical protein
VPHPLAYDRQRQAKVGGGVGKARIKKENLEDLPKVMDVILIL